MFLRITVNGAWPAAAGLLALWLALPPVGMAIASGTPEITPESTPPPAVTAGEVEPCQLEPEHGRLWRVNGYGGRDSYLFATLHLDDPRVLDFPAAVRQAMHAGDTLVLEAIHDEAEARRLQESMQNPPGTRLSDLVQPGLFERVRAILGDTGYTENVIQRYKPWAAALLVAYPRRGDSVFLDRQLYIEARAAGKRTLGLESLAEQAAVFDELPATAQVALLADAVRQYPAQDDVTARIITAYLRGDLPALMRQYREQTRNGGGAGHPLHRKLIAERNRVMARRLAPLLQQGGVFVAVGALHLPGEEGLLALLHREGATIRPVTTGN